MMRIQFNIPLENVARMQRLEFRASLKEALLLAFASKTTADIIAEHGEWFDEQSRLNEVHSTRIRVYEHETLLARLTPYKTRERSIIASYGIYLRDMVINEYVPLSMRMPHHLPGPIAVVKANGGEVKKERNIPKQTFDSHTSMSSTKEATSGAKSGNKNQESNSKPVQLEATKSGREITSNQPVHTDANAQNDEVNELQPIMAENQSDNQIGTQPSQTEQAADDDLSALKNMAQGLF